MFCTVLINTFLSKRDSERAIGFRSARGESSYRVFRAGVQSPSRFIAIHRRFRARTANNNIKFECALGNGRRESVQTRNRAVALRQVNQTDDGNVISPPLFRARRRGAARHDTTRVPGVARSRIQTDLRVNQNSNLVPGLEEIPNFVSPCPPALSSKRRRRARRRWRKARLRPRLRPCDSTFPFASNFVLNCELLPPPPPLPPPSSSPPPRLRRC